MNEDFRQLVSKQGIRQQHTYQRYRSSQNSLAERAIRTVTEMAASMLVDSNLPHYLWGDSLIHAAYIRNRILKAMSGITAHERLFGSKPSLAGLPIFGQSVVVRIADPLRFNGRGNIGAFVGFTEQIRGFKVYLRGHGRPIKETTMWSYWTLCWSIRWF